jgi:hypothetical protein
MAAPDSLSRIADRQTATQRKRFVGRTHELALFRETLSADEPPFAVWFIHGPGGVGKTTLLRECAHIAHAAGVLAVQLDGRTLDATPTGFLDALRAELKLSADDDPIAAWPQTGVSVLILDTFEQLAPLAPWLREDLLPRLPAHVRVIIAGRNAPDTIWRTDPDWRDLVRVLALRNLSQNDARMLLNARGVPEVQHDAIVSATHGHPLALALVADVAAQDGSAPLSLDQAPDVVAMLVEKFVARVPSTQHRLALQVCAHVRTLTEMLLREALAQEDVRELFDWLRGLSFVESSPHGIYPHDLARDVLDNEARWRDFETYRQMHFRLRNHYIAQMRRTQGFEQQRHQAGLIFLHRNNPLLKPYFDWKEIGSFLVEPVLVHDTEAIADLIARFEGDEAGKLAIHWLSRQPQQWRVVRNHHGECQGVVAHLHLDPSMLDAIQHDPGTAAAWAYAQRHAPPQPGEIVTVFRFAADAHTHQQLSPVFNALQLFAGTEWIVLPNVAWSFVAVTDPDAWRTMLSYYHFHRAPEADFTVGGTRYGMFAHDWRSMNLNEWLDRLFIQQINTEMTLPEILAAPPASPAPSAPRVVLSQEAFESAIKQALKDYTRPGLLAANPLMQSQMMRDLPDKGPDRLQALLREACEALRGNPKDEKLYRVLHRTYLQPAASQEAAAEALDLPFGTYRSQLINATKRVISVLWLRESGEA